MTAYLLKRLAIAALTLVAASLLVFTVLEVLPGDPARLMLGLNASPDAVAALREQLGPRPAGDRPLPRLGRATCCGSISAVSYTYRCR